MSNEIVYRNLKNQIVFITGANSGLGFECCKTAVMSGAHVVMLCRNLEKARNARDLILKQFEFINSKNKNNDNNNNNNDNTNNNNINDDMNNNNNNNVDNSIANIQIDIELIDLSDFNSVRSCAERLLNRYSHCNVLLNNAGVMLNERQVTVDGNCLTLQTNFLSHFLLTSLLWPLLLRAGSSARVCNVSSLTHLADICHADDLNMRHSWTFGFKEQAYCQSKLLNLMFSNELFRRLQV